MLEIKHNEAWKLLRVFAGKGERPETLAAEFNLDLKTVQEIIKAIMPPDSMSRVDRIYYLGGQGLGTTAIAYIMGEARGTIQHYHRPRNWTSEQRKVYYTERRSELKEIRAEYNIDYAPVRRRLRGVQPKIRAAGDSLPVRGNRKPDT